MNIKEIWKNYYFIIIPIVITTCVYFISLFFGFRNFDEDGLIKNFYVKKTFSEYVSKFLLLNAGGASEAKGFTFSGIKNIHVCILGLPSIHIIAFLFQAKPFLYHLWGLLLHCIALFFFIRFCFNFTQNKQTSMLAGLIWSIHPTCTESIVWATNWLQSLGAAFYFFTLSRIISLANKELIDKLSSRIFVFFITLVQILFTEHTITIPFAIFFTIFYQTKALNKAIRASIPSFIVIIGYWLVRTILISKAVSNTLHNSLSQTLERIIYFTPQIFLHQLKLIFFPLKLSIDQIDLLTLDKHFLGFYNIFCILFVLLFTTLILTLRNKLPFLSFGFLLYLVTISLFIQIIPLYSLSGERYNYLGAAFIIFGIIATFLNLNKNLLRQASTAFIIISLLLISRTMFRIQDWRDSSSLFQSAITTSNSLYKKGIWTYNLAICQEDENKKTELLKESTAILSSFIKDSQSSNSEPEIFKIYALDQKSIIAKALIRIATNYEILKNQNLQLKYLLKALKIAEPDSQIRAMTYKNLGTLYFQMNSLNKAISYYKKSYLISPDPTIDFAIAACYLNLKDSVNYEKYLSKAASKLSSDGDIFKAYGQLLEISKGNIKESIKYYRIATLLENKPEPYILLATAYLKLRELDNAFKVIKDGLYGFPEDPSLLYLHSTVLLGRGNTEAGLKGLVKVVRNINTPTDIKTEACNIIVSIFMKNYNLQDAKVFNDLALTIDPKNQEALKNKLILK